MSTDTAIAAGGLRRAVGRGEDLFQRVKVRAAALEALSCDSVLVPRRVSHEPDGTVVVEVPWVDGTDLGAIAMRRGPLSGGECAWLAAQIGTALTHMHKAGLVHGDLSPANVVVSGTGVVLVDTLSGCLEDELGTVGFRAPERPAGATLPGDVYSLGALLRWASEPSEQARVDAWTQPLLARDPAARPPITVATSALQALAPAVPISIPDSFDVVAAARSRAAGRTERIGAGRPWRVRKIVVRAGAAVATLGAGLGIVIAVPRAVDAVLAPAHAAVPAPAMSASALPTDAPELATASALPQPAQVLGDRAHAAQAAEHLTLVRVEALAQGDSQALRDLVAPSESGSAELSEGEARVVRGLHELAQAIEQGERSYEGLAVSDIEAELVSTSDDLSTVRLSYVLSAHTVNDQDGRHQVEAHEESVMMTLRWDGRWWVSEVSAAR
ncbi:protein kinase domain-containing protein [Demequina sp.]|uniref:protein kinase domain-containing protein n=1 Tax=Demequina sp. TaxID=2050685 RepID=UPI003A8454A1